MQYKLAKRGCLLKSPTRGGGPDWEPCKGVAYHFPMGHRGSQPLCELHARQELGDKVVDKLLALGLLSKWAPKPQTNNQSGQLQLPGWSNIIS
ncbi:MAG: hypothetical protein ACREHG_04320 [Candidatus Saccharimonadales bacterium]